MELILNIIVLLFEIVFYSLFMKFARKEGKFYRYILLFILTTFLVILFSSNSLIAYLVFVLSAYVGLKYIVKLKVSLYDMLIIFIMLLCKLIIEIPFYVLLINIINNFCVTVITSIFKISLICLLHNKIELLYKVLKVKWDNNNFYIRYIFSTLMFTYTIASCIFLIVKLF
jgi:hypothetical protein